MNQLNRKCFMASAGLHGLLFLILLVGPAFLMSRDKVHDMPVLEFIPDILVDDPVSGGGNPAVTTPPAEVRRPDPPKPTPPKPDPPKPTPPKVDPPKPTPSKADPPKPESTKWKPAETIPLGQRTTRNDKRETVKPVPDNSRQFADAARSLRSATSSTSIEMPSLGLGGGPAYANYAQAIKTLYEQNWYPPDQTSRDEAIVKVEIVIRKDGTVISSRIISRCGDAAVDGSVGDTLNRVKARGVPAFPAGAKESTRTYTIGFNLKARRAST